MLSLICTFGCLCFPLLCPYNDHELDFCSSPCVFLGYNNSHLGYRCLDLSSNHLYIARHVRFHENIFSFDMSEQNIAPPIQSPAAILKPLTSAVVPYSLQSGAPTIPPTPTSTPLTPLPLPAYQCHTHSTGSGSDLSFLHASSMAPVSPDMVLSLAGSPASCATSVSLVLFNLLIFPVVSLTGSLFQPASATQHSLLLSSSPPVSSYVSLLNLIYVLICLTFLFSKAQPVCLPLNLRLPTLIP